MWSTLTQRVRGLAARSGLLRVDHPDEDVRRRGRVLVLLACGLGSIGLVTAPLTLMLPDGHVYTAAFLGVSLVYLLVVWLARRGYVDLALVLMLGGYALALVLGVLQVGTVTTAPIFALLIITFAGTLMRPALVAPALLASLLLILGLPSLVGGNTRPITFTEQVFVVIVVSALTTLMAVVNAVGIRHALQRARTERDRSERLARDLRAANERLEARVAERTAALRDASLRDPLTGLHNRRYVDDQLARLVDAAGVGGTVLAVLALDVDDFKAVNECYGHAGGDRVLREIAGLLRAVTGLGDVIGRVGGEEFLVLLPATDGKSAVAVARRMVDSVRTAEWEGRLEGLDVTVSIGVAFHSGGMDGEELWRRADELLFDAKRSGKDRVCAAGGLGRSPAATPV